MEKSKTREAHKSALPCPNALKQICAKKQARIQIGVPGKGKCKRPESG